MRSNKQCVLNVLEFDIYSVWAPGMELLAEGYNGMRRKFSSEPQKPIVFVKFVNDSTFAILSEELL